MKAFYVTIAKRNGSVFISAFDTEEEAKHFLTAEDIKKGDIVERSTDYDFSDEEWNEMIENDYRKEA